MSITAPAIGIDPIGIDPIGIDPIGIDPIGIDPTPLPPGSVVTGRRQGWARIAKLVLGVLVAAMLTTELVLVGPSIASAAADLARSSAGWLAVAAVAALGSMVAFAAVRRQTLRTAGVTVPLRTALAVSYAAGAVHTTLPGGTVLSTGYAFRRLRTWGASTVVATWCLTVTGLLATATLSVIGLTGLLLGGGGTGSLVPSVVEIGAVLLAMAGIVRLTRNPDRLGLVAGQVLRWINRFRRRPAETGYAVLATLIEDLQTIRPARSQWAQAWVLSMLNWALDAACLAACLAALGVHVGFAALLLTYTAGMAASSLTAVPGGLGVVEAALTLGLTTAGVPLTAALGAVLVYRILSLGGVVVIGWTVLAVQQLRAGAPAPCTTPADPTVTGRNPLSGSLFRGAAATLAAVVPGAPVVVVGDGPTVIDPSPARSSVPGRGASHPIHLTTGTPDTARSDRDEPGAPGWGLSTIVRAREVMTGNPDHVAPTDSWQQVARTMRDRRATALPVCDEHGGFCGIIDYRDIGVRCLAEGGSAATARTLTRDAPFTIGIDDTVAGMTKRMAEQKAWLIPVLDGRRLIGVIHYAHLLARENTGGMTPGRELAAA